MERSRKPLRERRFTITLLSKPLVIKGKSRVRGEVITLHLDSERVEVVNATIHSTEIGK